MIQAPAPARLIEGGLPTEATVAQVMVANYADHLPLHRQAQIHARQGVRLDRSTLADWSRARRLVAGARSRPVAGAAEALGEALRRRDGRAGARSWPRPHEDEPEREIRGR